MRTERDGKAGQVYAVGHPGASLATPLSVQNGQSVNLADAFFSTAPNPDTPNAVSIAVNHYASLVDTVRFVHIDQAIPFFLREHGDVNIVYPSTRSRTATAKSKNEIVISNFEGSAWPHGRVATHEYGHVMMQRAWNGSYGAALVGISTNDNERAPQPRPQIAFKEAWAEFMTNVVFAAQRPCSNAALDDNDPADYQRYLDNRIQIELFGKRLTSEVLGPLRDGTSYRWNVRKALCDWYDTRNDDDPSLDGSGDSFNETNFASMWTNLRQMFVQRNFYNGQFNNPGFQFCDWVNYYLEVRKGAHIVGEAEHARAKTQIDNLTRNANIQCLPPTRVSRAASRIPRL